jgi:hypothetical protein
LGVLSQLPDYFLRDLVKKAVSNSAESQLSLWKSRFLSGLLCSVRFCVPISTDLLLVSTDPNLQDTIHLHFGTDIELPYALWCNIFQYLDVRTMWFGCNSVNRAFHGCVLDPNAWMVCFSSQVTSLLTFLFFDLLLFVCVRRSNLSKIRSGLSFSWDSPKLLQKLDLMYSLSFVSPHSLFSPYSARSLVVPSP